MNNYYDGYNNLFSAEHRELMIETYGATSAMWIKLGELGATNEERHEKWLP